MSGDDVGRSYHIRRSHNMHIVASQEIGFETVHLVRLRKEADNTELFIRKTCTDFVVLIDKLREYLDVLDLDSSDLEPDSLVLAKGRFGFRRALSKLTNRNSLANEALRIEMAMELVLSQVVELRSIAPLVDFFAQSEDCAERNTINDMVSALRVRVSLLSLSGYWKLADSKRIWSISEDGTAHVDGNVLDAIYHLHEEDSSDSSLSRTIFRKDGWAVDLDRSNNDMLIWVKAGQPVDQPSELAWGRLAREEAQPAIDKAVRKREAHRTAMRESEKSRIREAILQRVAAKRAADDVAKANRVTAHSFTTCSEASTDVSPAVDDVADDQSSDGQV